MNSFAYIARAPHRISLFGGGTDLPEYLDTGKTGVAINCSIANYVYTTVKSHSSLFDERLRLSYSEVEKVKTLQEVKNKLLKSILEYFKVIDSRLYISVISDIPESCGLSSSSSFACALIKNITDMLDIRMSKSEIADTSFRIERNLLGRRTGLQDAYAVSLGGINYWEYRKVSETKYFATRTSLAYNKALISMIENNCILVWCEQRKEGASFLDKSLVKEDSRHAERVNDNIAAIAAKAYKYLVEDDKANHGYIAGLLKESYEEKIKTPGYRVTEEVIRITSMLEDCKVRGFKLVGAGGGGFVLAVVDESQIEKIKKAVGSARLLRCSLDWGGVVKYVSVG